jgi:hypothetical protein
MPLKKISLGQEHSDVSNLEQKKKLKLGPGPDVLLKFSNQTTTLDQT